MCWMRRGVRVRLWSEAAVGDLRWVDGRLVRIDVDLIIQ